MSFSYRLSVLDQNAPQPELMERMMGRMVVNSNMATRIDGGMAWYEARTKCIFCRRERQCRNWLEGGESLREPTDFCPNVEFFRQCADVSVHDRPPAA
jgi:Family of unknown function (DUF6455)